MSKPIIEVQNLGKIYHIGQEQNQSDTLVGMITNSIRTPLKRAGRLLRGQATGAADLTEEFWALQDVNFNVEQGEVIGIIGRNGAGKSTLLKIMSRITPPSTGSIRLTGRVGSLLEVGTGFHAELTGRENVFLNGSILGMSNEEIKRKFDEIVDFAGVEQFIDTPVKHYSSGMGVRLGFAVAAFLEPEILIVDEVLSVGDAEFQRKSLGRMSDVSSQGRTVLFVSHNMAAVENLCKRGIVLTKGQVTFDGSQTEAISQYMNANRSNVIDLSKRTDRTGSGEIKLTGFEMKLSDGQLVDMAITGQDIELHFHYQLLKPYKSSRVIMSFILKTMLDVPIFQHHNRLTGNVLGTLPESGTFVCKLKNLPLLPSTYRLDCAIMEDTNFIDLVTDAIELPVTGSDFFGSGRMPDTVAGYTIVDGEWDILPNQVSKKENI